jgi:hypothetical protein
MHIDPEPAPHHRGTAAGVASLSHAMANRSKSIMKRECAPAQGTGTVVTPCVAQCTRGTRAWSCVSY